ncbi:MAG: bifunctional diguanylate cyclase/phosphodiesterase [Marinobacter sp.]
MAKYDSLTGLPNRVLLGDRLEQAMKVADRTQHTMAVLFIDLDGFKAINDGHGHAAGDLLLKQVTSKISHELRAGDTLARFGGDEFVVVLPELSDADACQGIAERILAAIAGIQVLMGYRVSITASIGIVLHPQSDIEDADQLFRQADQAMYAAKQKGKNQIQFFDIDNEKATRDKHEHLAEISRGLGAGEFVLFYQPKINLRTREIIGVEALIRWQHPQHGLLAPSQFLPFIDRHPLSVTVGEWVLETAFTQLQEWRQIGLDVPISVNIDPFHLVQPDFEIRLAEILQRYPWYREGDIELEIMETGSLEKLEEVAETIHACRRLGFSFSLDDFGTGYSSLAYLRGLPVNRLKIDMTFVRDMLSDRSDFAIVEGVLWLARSFDLCVIAEGVETAEHIDALVEMGCQFGQGYGIARPMENTAMPGWVLQWGSPTVKLEASGREAID